MSAEMLIEAGLCRSCPPEDHPSIAEIGARPSSRGFIAMLEAYRSTGGMAPGNLLCQSLQNHQQGDLSYLSCMIVDRRIFVVDWRGDSWIPMFQFDAHDLTCKPGPALVRAELENLSSGWAIGAWFARPNAMLDGCRPVTLMDSDLAAVIAAARSHSLARIRRAPP